ncbi:MAG: DUF2150 family protein [Salinarchaeum sp.]
MDEPPQEFYSEDRWQNWIDRIETEDIDPEEEASARLLLNLQDDVAIAVAKIVRAYEEDVIDDDRAYEEVDTIRQIVLGDPDIEDEETALLVDGVQTGLMCVFYAAEEYIASGAATDASITEYLRAAADAEAEEDLDVALGYAAQAGTRVIDGEDFDASLADDMEYGLVTEWINGLDSLRSAMSDPEVIEED